jgi:hypothetical protein
MLFSNIDQLLQQKIIIIITTIIILETRDLQNLIKKIAPWCKIYLGLGSSMFLILFVFVHFNVT